MASLGMGKPLVFSANVIRTKVDNGEIGNYALGYLQNDEGENSTFIVQYVGRSDTDLQRRLLEHIGERYSHFKFCYASSPRDAFLRECQNYHDFGGCKKLRNDRHPDKPNGTNWKCPVCGV